MRGVSKAQICAVAVFCAATNSITESVAQNSPVQLDTVEVEAGGNNSATGPVQGYVATDSASGTKTDTPLIETPQSISVITRDQMRAQGVDTLAQAYRYTPGINGEPYGADARGTFVDIRGFASTSDNVLYRDGLSLRGSAFTSFGNIDPYGAERVEVVRGPASVLYGQGDPGGIVNYVSKRPLETPFHEVELGLGNRDYVTGKVDLSGPVNQEKTLFYRLTGLVRDNDTQVDFVSQNRIFVAPAVTWKPNADTSLTVLGHFQRDDNGWDIQFLPAKGTVFPNPNGQIPTSRFTGEPDFDHYGPTQYSAGYLFEHRATEVWTVRQNARFQHFENNDQSGVFGNGGPGFGLRPDDRTYVRYGDFGASQLDAFVIDNQAQAKFGTGPLRHTLLLGLDFANYGFHDLGRSMDGAKDLDIFNPVYGSVITPGAWYQNTQQDQQQTGLYAQDQIKLGNWVLSMGFRQDWAKTTTDERRGKFVTEQSDDALTGRIGLLYKFDNGIAPYVSYATSFLPQLGTTLDGAPFKPETGEQYEAGVKYQPPGWNAFVTLAAFDLTRQNTLTVDPNNPNFSVQTGETNSRGIEAEVSASLASGWDIKAAYTFTDIRVTESNDGLEGSVPYGVPKHRVALWADYTIRSGQYSGLGFGGGLRYQSSSYGNDINTFKVPGFWVADAVVHYDWQQWRFAVNARNLFDETYVASCYDTHFGCFYGERRTVVASARYRW